MEDQQMLPHFVNTINDFKDTYVWQFLTSNGLKYLLGSLIIVSTFFWSCFLFGYIQLIKPLYYKFFPTKDTEIQKTEELELVPSPLKSKGVNCLVAEKVDRLKNKSQPEFLSFSNSPPTF